MGANTVEYRQEYNKNKSKTIKLSNLIFPAEMSKIYVWGEKKMEKVWRQKLELCLLHKRRCLIIWCGRKSGQTIWSRIWGVIFFFFCGCSSGLKSWDDSPKEKKNTLIYKNDWGEYYASRLHFFFIILQCWLYWTPRTVAPTHILIPPKTKWATDARR